ncbi:MAG: hypothetical protein ACUZ8E_17535 [Candidatus Anammoxibacter sp.]
MTTVNGIAIGLVKCLATGLVGDGLIETAILLEDGTFILLEDGSRILKES